MSDEWNLVVVGSGRPTGDAPANAVLDHRHRVCGHDGRRVGDGSAISVNPGASPCLTIAALAERGVSFVQPKGAAAC